MGTKQVSSSAGVGLLEIKKDPHATADVVMFHHAGGSSFAYANMLRNFQAKVNIYCFELAGRGTRMFEQLRTDGKETINEVITTLKHHQLGQYRPLQLFGHSLGAELVFHVAQALHNKIDPQSLTVYLSARPLEGAPTQSISRRLQLSDEALIDLILEYGETPKALIDDPEMRQYLIDTMRNDLALLHDLSRLPKSPLECKAFLVGGEDDPHVEMQSLYLWQRCFEKPLEITTFSGDHFYLFRSAKFLDWFIQKIMSSDRAN